jgi:hypothetical protein
MCYPADAMVFRSVVRFRRESMEPRVAAQLRSSSGRSSKLLKDRTCIETVVEVAGAGTLVLAVDGAGGYSLRAYPEGGGDAARDLLAVGVVRPDGILVVSPGASPATDAEQVAPVQSP